MNTEAIEKESNPARERWCWWHWQNLTGSHEEADATGFPWSGRCWWRFRSNGKNPPPDIGLEWSLGRLSFGLSAGIDDEHLTFGLRLPLLSVFLSFSTSFRLIDRLAPKKPLNPERYPGVIVIDEREISFAIHGGRAWLKIWGGDDWTRSDPWWKRGVSVPVNPFEPIHMRHEVRCLAVPPQFGLKFPQNYWEPFIGSWEQDKGHDHRDISLFDYRYVLKSGEVQERTATVFVERRAWRPKCLRWTSLFEKVRTSIDVAFSDEVGERTGSWKGGTIGCGWELLPGETPEQALRRMEAVRRFD